MADNSSIQWTEATWNVATGCTRASEGCRNCYIERTPPFRMQHRRFDGTEVGATTGVMLHPDRLSWPLRWKSPRMIFVNSLADLFHEAVPDEYIAQVFAVMAVASQHTFQLLTKRHGRMRSLLNSSRFVGLVQQQVDALRVKHAIDSMGKEKILPVLGYPQEDNWEDRKRHGNGRSYSKLTEEDVQGIRRRVASGERTSIVATDHGISETQVNNIVEHRQWRNPAPEGFQWPLPGVWIGVSVENQQWANIRIPALLRTPAAVRFISAEPLLGPVDLTQIRDWCPTHDKGMDFCVGPCPDRRGLSWVIAGGESGRGARPMDVEWVRRIVKDCQSARTAVFVKQMGSVWASDWTVDGKTVAAHGDRKGGNWDYWPADLRVREFPADTKPVEAEAVSS